MNFTRQVFVRVSSCGLANFYAELGYTMTACLKEDASACIGMATRLGPARSTETRGDQVILHCNTGYDRDDLLWTR